MAEKKEFKAESKRLLDLMINSIYTHKEIFLRELISNASDAIDKYYYYALQNHQDPGDLAINIQLDVENRLLTIQDDGIGMDKEELEENLGTIAKSGSLAFKEELAKKEKGESDVDIIGQFGVGFYAAFMVAKEVKVISKKAGSDEAYEWVSDGANGYTIEPAIKEGHGTTVILSLKEDDDTERYSQYLDSNQISDLVKKYSDFIRYPIKMDVEVERMIESTKDQEVPEYETVKENKTLNSMVPLWKRPKSEITKEEFDQFYKEHFYDYSDPMKTIFFNVEGNVSFTALLYIPSHIPTGFYSQDYKPGLQLYSRGVFIMDHCEELLPDYLRFVKGLVDSQDLSLNISREMLQQNHQLRIIRNRIEKKVLNELSSMLVKDRKEYETFWKNFGLDLKFGVYNNFGQDKDKLENLLLFNSTKDGQLTTLSEYVDRMKEDQKPIYYVTGSSLELMEKLPIVKKLESKGFEVLLFNAEVDEFVVQTLMEYREHPFQNASQGDLDLDSEEEKKELEEKTQSNQSLLDFMKETLKGEVEDVRLSSRLVDDPVTLVAGNGMSFEMEKVYAALSAQNGNAGMPPMKATRILEINPNNGIFAKLQNSYESDPEKAKEITKVLYDQALLIEGFPIQDPIEYSRLVCTLLSD
ncbi:molecular chaperone HtpG [Dubosiella newyorkensis]|jgi:molecular chaperone HtpG|uniref:molecular chaperone HtpG n=1 Tax=Dubosiella newyorkensis TaxID=1862672 RepID=UPI0023543612|nr:molecular chaperone HtpG [Dubosiella newyorkensis]MCI9041708.1 molecular chaperone HtpG [Dubosiella newyorkensis]